MYLTQDHQERAQRYADHADQLTALRMMATYLMEQLAPLSGKSAFAAGLLVESLTNDIELVRQSEALGRRRLS